MKTLPKCSMDVHAYLAMVRAENKRKVEAERAKKAADLSRLLSDIAKAFKVDVDHVKGGDQQQLIVTVRKIFYFIGRTKMDATYNAMTQIVGRQSHRGSIYHIRKVREWLKDNDKEFVTLWNHYLENSKLYTQKDFQ